MALNPQTSCLSDDAVHALLFGQFEATQLTRVELHLAGCECCRALVAETAGYLAREDGSTMREFPSHVETVRDLDAPQARGSSARIEIGVQIGRYVLLNVTGTGGMGVVYAAFDPSLQRTVALKLLHPKLSSSTTVGDARDRLLREARAMAQVSSPHVVAVHDVGTFDDQVFVAMEFIDGRTLRTWLREERRSWREVVDVFIAAARGLMAAHTIGLVHRDFKPENVLIGADGRVRVTDFGLARPIAFPAEPDGSRGLASTFSPLRHDLPTLTLTGVLAGTPAYMAPEQFRGEPADPRTDQFSFCVSLYEGLYGERPFPGNSVTDLAKAVVLGELREPVRSRSVPDWLHEAVVRGLCVKPESRFPSMEALLAALMRPEPRARRVRPMLVLAGALVVSAATGLMWRARSESAPPAAIPAAVTPVTTDRPAVPPPSASDAAQSGEAAGIVPNSHEPGSDVVASKPVPARPHPSPRPGTRRAVTGSRERASSASPTAERYEDKLRDPFASRGR